MNTVDELEQTLEHLSAKKSNWKVSLFDLNNEADRASLSRLLQEGEVMRVVDNYEEQLKELFQIHNPTIVYAPDFGSAFQKWRDSQCDREGKFIRHGRWAFFPWMQTLVHVLPDADFQRVRTARNRNLITEEEQKRYYDAVVGIGGLSVGNSVALAIALQGGARRVRLADFDTLGLSNLNRIRSDVTALGLKKVEMTARQLYALNPYAAIELFPEGLTEENIERFFDGPPRLDVIVDELDTIPIKLRIREEAKKRKIPVVMGADNGDNAIIDIERHDSDGKTPFFHGMLGNVTVRELSGLDKFGIGKTITKMLGPENITIRMQDSLLQMGKTIVSWPQLGGAALLNGIGVAYCVRKIVNGEKLAGDRALLSLDEKLELEYHTPEAETHRREASKKFASIFGL